MSTRIVSRCMWIYIQPIWGGEVTLPSQVIFQEQVAELRQLRGQSPDQERAKESEKKSEMTGGNVTMTDVQTS